MWLQFPRNDSGGGRGCHHCATKLSLLLLLLLLFSGFTTSFTSTKEIFNSTGTPNGEHTE